MSTALMTESLGKGTAIYIYIVLVHRLCFTFDVVILKLILVCEDVLQREFIDFFSQASEPDNLEKIPHCLIFTLFVPTNIVLLPTLCTPHNKLGIFQFSVDSSVKLLKSKTSISRNRYKSSHDCLRILN